MLKAKGSLGKQKGEGFSKKKSETMKKKKTWNWSDGLLGNRFFFAVKIFIQFAENIRADSQGSYEEIHTLTRKLSRWENSFPLEKTEKEEKGREKLGDGGGGVR